MFSYATQPLSTLVLKNGITEFKNQLTGEFTDTISSNKKIVNGNILYLIDQTKQSFSNLIETDFGERKLVQGLFDNISAKPISVNLEGTYEECIKFIAKARAKAGTNFYGAILRSTTNKNVLINPFHPLTALAITSDIDAVRLHKFNILMYFYPNRAKMDNVYNSNSANLDKMKQNINQILQTYTSLVKVERKVNSIEMIHDDSFKLTTSIKIPVTNIKNYKSNKLFYMVSHQVLTKGILIPYYGASILQKSNSSKVVGKHITPFNSANIYSGNGWSSVCTGSLPHNDKGFRSLTHSNLSSAYSKNLLADGALLYADICINTAFNIYHKTGIIDSLDGLIYEPKVRNILDDLPEHLAILATTNRIAFTIEMLKLEKNTSEIASILSYIKGN